MNENMEKGNVEVFVRYPNSPGERQEKRVLSSFLVENICVKSDGHPTINKSQGDSKSICVSLWRHIIATYYTL